MGTRFTFRAEALLFAGPFESPIYGPRRPFRFWYAHVKSLFVHLTPDSVHKEEYGVRISKQRLNLSP
jgi:hypothetical protein